MRLILHISLHSFFSYLQPKLEEFSDEDCSSVDEDNHLIDDDPAVLSDPDDPAVLSDPVDPAVHTEPFRYTTLDSNPSNYRKILHLLHSFDNDFS